MIRTMHLRIGYLFSILFSFQSLLDASQIITGNSSIPTETFTFPVQASISSAQGEYLYVGASPSTAGTEQSKEYAISRVASGAVQFKELAPKMVTVNNKENEPNPLYDAGIERLGLLISHGEGFASSADRPIAIITNKPSNVYLLENPDRGSVLFVENIKDALKATTPRIFALAATHFNPSGIFVAVANQAGTFYGSGSGVALLSLNQKEVGENKKKELWLSQGDAQAIKENQKRFKRAAPINPTSDFLKIGAAVAAIENVVDMHWDQTLHRLYIALQLQAGAGASDGAKAIIVGQVNTFGGIEFKSIAPDAVFTANNGLVATVGANERVSIHKVRTMHTSTGLSYLIILGGNGDPASTKRTLYALPLVNTMNEKNAIGDPAIQGTLADKNAPVKEIFTQGKISFLMRREIEVPATTPADIFTDSLDSSNDPARIGTGALQEGDVEDFQVAGDAIFVRVANADPNQNPGVFYSQALFDTDDKIKTWTPWQRAAATTNPVYGFSYENKLAQTTMMFGADAAHVNTVRRTIWGQGAEQTSFPLNKVIAEQFPKEIGGIQGFFDFNQHSKTLNGISMMIATGLNKIALIESGQITGGTFSPLVGDAFLQTQEFKDGTLDINAHANVLFIEGGALNSIGSIVAAEIAHGSGHQGFLFVGGHGGLAVLSNPDGTGWDTLVGLGPQFAGLIAGMSFKKVGNYSFVNKIIYDNGFLYILTDKKLDRIDLTDSGFPAVTIARVEDVVGVAQNGAFLDVIVSDKLGLLATSGGLFRVSNGNTIQNPLPESISWVFVPVPEGYGPILQLVGFSMTGFSQDVARVGGGNVYALSAYLGKYQAQLNRFAIKSVENNEIDETTVLPIRDLRIKDTLAGYVNFAGPRNLFASDGSIVFGASNRDLQKNPFVKAGFLKKSFVTVPIDISYGSLCAGVLRNTALGNWIVAGDMGLRFNE